MLSKAHQLSLTQHLTLVKIHSLGGQPVYQPQVSPKWCYWSFDDGSWGDTWHGEDGRYGFYLGLKGVH